MPFQVTNRLALAALVTLLALAVILSLNAPVSAHAGRESKPANHHGTDGRMHQGSKQHSAALATLAQTLKLSEAALQTALQAGKSVATVAAAQNVPLDQVVNALLAEYTTRLQAKVTAGRLTQAQADARLADLRTRLPEQLRAQPAPNHLGGSHNHSGQHSHGSTPAQSSANG